MRLNLRRGLMAGTALAVVLATSVAARSSAPLQTFGYVLAVALAMVLLAMAIIVAIDRRARRRSER